MTLFKRNIFITALLSLFSTSAFSAKPINLNHQPHVFSNNLIGQPEIQIIHSEIDFNQTTHLRINELFKGYRVWGGDFTVHIANAGQIRSIADFKNAISKTRHLSMDGIIYQNLAQDLVETSSQLFTAAQLDEAFHHAVTHYETLSHRKAKIEEAEKELVVYVDKNNKAHWAFYFTFLDRSPNQIETKPTFLIDAQTFQIYEYWNDIQTLDDVSAGGYGNNIKLGRFEYKNQADNLGNTYVLPIQRDPVTKICYLRNNSVVISDYNTNPLQVIKFNCADKDATHNNLYWNADLDQANGGYSPSNDVLFNAMVAEKMYRTWYNIPMLIKSDGTPMVIQGYVHERIDNASWNGSRASFGDGVTNYYPLTTLDVVAHEFGHGFTRQHAALVYSNQSGGLNESFSDIAGAAATYFLTGTYNWQVGSGFTKGSTPLRYMDEPTKKGSISHISKYYDGMGVHTSSGIFNKVYYLISTSKYWNQKEAFDIMVQANRYYWTSNITFANAACGVMKATADFHYPPQAVINAFSIVGIDSTQC